MLYKNCSVDDLISTVEGSSNEKIREKSLRFLVKSGVRNDVIFKFLESLITTDENPFMRRIALKEIYQNYKNKSKSLLKWVIEHEYYGIVIQTLTKLVIFDEFKEKNDIFNLLKDKLCRYMNDIKIDFSKAIGLLSLEKRLIRKIEKNIEKIPDFVFQREDFKLLRVELNNYLSSIHVSESILRFVKNKVAPKYAKIGVDFFESIVLGVLEVFCGPFLKFEKIVDPISHMEVIEYHNLLFKENETGNLETLHISGRNGPILYFFPELISELKDLKVLDLSCNSIAELPNSIFKLKNLEYLDLGNNNLKEVAERFTELKLLRFLNLRMNRLTKVPNAIINMKSLVGLDLFLQQNEIFGTQNGIPTIRDPMIQKEFETIKENFTNSQQILFYRYFMDECEDIEGDFRLYKDNLFKNTKCKHEKDVDFIFPYTLFCFDCKESLELWRYGLHHYAYRCPGV